MVRTEEDMIVNHIDHHYIGHYQDIFYNILNLKNFSMKRNCTISSINTMNLKMIMEMKGLSKKGRGFANPNPNGKGRFLNSNKKDKFLISIYDKGGGYSNLDKFGILFLMGS